MLSGNLRQQCIRRVGGKEETSIPISWLGDEVEDCQDGTDEMLMWPTCGVGKSMRFVTSNESCDNVFLCPNLENPGFVELTHFCDGLDSCGNEVCAVMRRSFDTIHSVRVRSSRNGLDKYLSYCIKGLTLNRNITTDLRCITHHSFIFPNHQFFGVENKTTVTLPAAQQNCDHMFGEMYVYTSCTNKCINSSCPLKTIPKYEMCPGQYSNRIGTIANDEYLTFFTRSYDNTYSNKYFVCSNKMKCIEYFQVCNLVDDCGDGSDEEACTNHFKCNSTGNYIPKTEKCDGSFDCDDLSDECNDQCSRQILETSFFKGLSWIIGVLATLANLLVIAKNISTLKRCRTSVALLNKTLIAAISFGDLLIGSYLIIISWYDSIVFKDSYCKRQIEWVTSSNCSVIGILSTIGSQISLFAMCVLSVTRIIGIYNSMKIPGEVTSVKSIQVGVGVMIILLLSTSIAVIPILTTLEDFFVNGVKYADELEVFIGTPNKHTVMLVLEAYYGRMKDTTLSWGRINQMVEKMYSHDFQYPDYTKNISTVDFYGNDGVCLFKYFVKNTDPQRLFVWIIIALNFVCFVFISLSYLVISYISRKSSKSFTQTGGNQQISQRNRKMNRKIFIIITTDFLCWIPFIVTCILHSIEILDATPWYSLFSIMILPINSVINPLIYDDISTKLILTPMLRLRTLIINTRVYQNFQQLLGRRQEGAETYEMSSRVQS